MDQLLNGGLVAVMRHGPEAAGCDLAELRGQLERLQEMLAQEAGERHPDWRSAIAAEAETVTLLELECAIARRASEITARGLPCVIAKLAIWEMVAADGAEERDGICPDNGLVHSALADLRRLARRRTR